MILDGIHSEHLSAFTHGNCATVALSFGIVLIDLFPVLSTSYLN